MDIALTFSPGTRIRADWSVVGGDLAKGQDLATAIAVCLFSDRQASDDYVPPAPVDPDKRGWWGERYIPQLAPQLPGFQLGCRWWQRARAVKTDQLLRQFELDGQEALQPLVLLGVVDSFDVAAQWRNKTMIVVVVTAHMPTGAPQTFPYSWVWNEI